VTVHLISSGLAARAADWRWSSVHAHLGDIDDGITARDPIRSRYPDFAGLLAAEEDEDRMTRLRKAERIGRPVAQVRQARAETKMTALSPEPPCYPNISQTRRSTGIRE